MLIESIYPQGILSFNEEGVNIPLGALNVLIGPNGAGKSNVLEIFELLRNLPENITNPIRQGGGIQDWLWKGEATQGVAKLSVAVSMAPQNGAAYTLDFHENRQSFSIISESLFLSKQLGNGTNPFHTREKDSLNLWTDEGAQRIPLSDDQKSFFAQFRDPLNHPEITLLAETFGKIRVYRDWVFGRKNPARIPQKVDLPNNWLETDGSNLGLVLNRLHRERGAKKRLLEALQILYRGIDDYDVQFEGGTVQVFFHEGDKTIPATRLSDGTLRYLCLLTILLHPSPPPLVCIEEPELGLHPDILPSLADLIKEASERCQLIITTHSDVLVDAMTDRPESILVCEKHEERGTHIQRLNPEKLKHWLRKYRLGEIWTRGEIGGNRW